MVADINVERKQPSIWPWVVGLVVLALLIWVGVEMFRGDPGEGAAVTDRDTTSVGAPATPGSGAPPAPMTQPAPAARDTMGVIPDADLP